MSCDCENRKKQSDYEKIAGLAKKAAVMEHAVYVVYRRPDGTYAFDREDAEIEGEIIEFKHYL